jgi:vanillate O-demethylase monooxygenase subunit
MYIRNCWYVAAWSHELGSGALISRTISNEAIVLYRTGNGGAVGLEDRCCHRFAPLSKGQLEGDDLRCLYHGLKFNRHGACIEIPGQDTIPPKARVKTYPVVEKHSWIWVWMGDPALADPALIPPAVGLDDPKWTLGCGQLDYDAGYQLINDNLTDFSHLSYVHRNSFGADEEWARTRPKITRIERGIRVQRWTRAPSFSPDGVRSPDKMVDLWTSYDYLAPGILLMLSATYPPDTAERCGGEAPAADLAPIDENFTSQAVTPVTDSTSRYFFSWGPPAGEGSDAKAEMMLVVAHKAFAEDKVMIESQQQVINRNPPTQQVLTSADAGPVRMRMVIEQMIRAENAAPVPAPSDLETAS